MEREWHGRRLGDPSYRAARVFLVARAVVRPLCRALFRLEVVDGEKVPATGPVILAGTHRSNLDTPFLAMATHRPVNFMGKQEFFKYGWSQRLFSGLGVFPVDRGKADKASLGHALGVLGSGDVVALYPEGTRMSGPTIEEIHRGAVWLAARTGAVVVPVGIGGSERVQPKGAKFVRPAKVRLVVGDPLPAPLTRRRDDVLAGTDVLRKALQDVFDRAGGPDATPVGHGEGPGGAVP